MAIAPKDHTGRRIRSVEIAFAIIEAIRRNDQPTVTELANDLGHSKSTIYSHLQTLVDQGIIVRYNNGYRLSLQILDIANDVRNQVINYDVVQEEVDRLADKTGEIVQFGLEEQERVSYLYKVRGNQAVETRSRVGMSQPMYSTSLGKAILAYLPPKEMKDIVSSMNFEQKTPYTITTPEKLFEELETIAEQGYAIDDEENIEGLRCVAAPIRSDDTVLGAISITGPASRMTNDRLHGEVATSVQRAANVIELNTKFA